ncbi:MAG: proton-conducting transporter membrane subunit, partial [Candidatus Latescibacteria bacterium]|nr:proton-conducting transporter membrane subunit [Candidatus Latescibacterota bacterium]
MTGITTHDIAVILPHLVVLGGAILVLLWDAFHPSSCRVCATWIGAAALLVATALFYQTPTGIAATSTMFAFTAFGDAILIDGMAVFAGMLICAIALVTVLVAEGYLAARDLSIGEFQAMLLFSTFGMLMMVSSNHLIVIFASLETLSLALYVLIGFRKTHSDSAEAAVKYFLLGGFASAFFLYGVALVYGKTGSVLLGSELAFTVSPMVRVGVALLIVGIAFKISAVPFHLWTPDVYQGAPTPTTGFLAAASKTAAVVVLLRIVYPAVATDG